MLSSCRSQVEFFIYLGKLWKYLVLCPWILAISFVLLRTSFKVLLVLIFRCYIISCKISSLSLEKGLKWNCDRSRLGRACEMWCVSLWQAGMLKLLCFLFKSERELYLFGFGGQLTSKWLQICPSAWRRGESEESATSSAKVFVREFGSSGAGLQVTFQFIFLFLLCLSLPQSLLLLNLLPLDAWKICQWLLWRCSGASSTEFLPGASHASLSVCPLSIYSLEFLSGICL